MKNNDVFYLKHQNTLGNLRWLIRLAIIITVIEIMISGPLSFAIEIFGLFSETINQFQTTVFPIINNTLNIIIWKFTPSFDDCFFIKEEMQLLWTLYVLGFVVFVIWFGIGLFVSYDAFSVFVVVGNFPVLVTFSVIIIALVWVRYKLKKYRLLTIDDAYGAMADQSNPDGSMTNTNSENKKAQATKKMMPLITDNNGFEIFMKHLLHEFSSETLLSVAEFMQLKELVKTKYGYVCTCDKSIHVNVHELMVIEEEKENQKNKENGKNQEKEIEIEQKQEPEDETIMNEISRKFHSIAPLSISSASMMSESESTSGLKIIYNEKIENYQLPSIVPKSSIVFQNTDNLYLIIEQLYQKYIDSKTATCEINISYDLKLVIQDRMAWINELFHDQT